MVHIFTGIVHKKKSTIYLEANCTIYIHTFILWVLILDLLNSAPYKTPPEVQKIDGIDPWLCSCSPGKWGSLEQWDRWFGRVPYLSMWATKKGPCLFRVYRGLSYLVMWGLWWNGSPPFGLPTACFTLLKKKTLWCHWSAKATNIPSLSKQNRAANPKKEGLIGFYGWKPWSF